MDSFIGQMETPPARPWSAKGSAGGGRLSPRPRVGAGEGVQRTGEGRNSPAPSMGEGQRVCAIFLVRH